MYTYFLSDYISAMSSVDIRKLKKITKAEFIQLISLLISMFFGYCNNDIISNKKNTILFYY